MLKIFALSLLAAIIITFGATANTLQLAEYLVEEAILDNEAFENPENKIEIRLTKGRNDLEKSASDDLEITGIEIDTDKKTFSGFALSGGLIPMEISGKYTELTQIPAVNRKIGRDEIITASDIKYVEIDTNKLSRGYIIADSELIGKSPTRTLFKGRPVMPSQIALPTLVKKKQAVTMIFRNNLLEMQDIGVAMEDGAEGELIRIRNENSNIIVNARVLANSLVEVETGRKIMAYNNLNN